MTLPCLVPLSPDQQRAAGVPQTWPLAVADRVRFSELDRLNHVNNTAYLVWFETIRIRYFQDWGISHYRPQDPRLVIRRTEADYLAEMHMDELYVITIRCAAFRTTSFTLHSEVWAGGTRRAAFGGVVVMLDPDGSGRYAIPPALRQRFLTVDGATAPP